MTSCKGTDEVTAGPHHSTQKKMETHTHTTTKTTDLVTMLGWRRNLLWSGGGGQITDSSRRS